MKWMIASDIHGDADFCAKMLERFDAEQADRLILLGDLLYHGPRNDLPPAYAPKAVIELLNARREKILCVRGNCESDAESMVLTFPVTADLAVVAAGERLIYLTHGHVYNDAHLPALCPGDVLLCGHTHVPRCEEKDGVLFLNPGSVTFPKENSPHSYMTLEKGNLLWKDLGGCIFGAYCL